MFGSFVLYSYGLHADIIQEYEIKSVGNLNGTSRELDVLESNVSIFPTCLDMGICVNNDNLAQYRVKVKTCNGATASLTSDFCIDTTGGDGSGTITNYSTGAY